MNFFIFLAGIFLLIFFIGRILEKIRVPWIFSALLIGLGLSAYNPFKEITSSNEFLFMAELGMYFILFIIGFELNIKQIIKSGSILFKTTIVIILTEAFFGAIFIHFVLKVPLHIAILVAMSFATIGEAVLLPILEEFNLVKTKLGQTILGIGVLDDVIEVITIVFASIFIGDSVGHTPINIWINLLILTSLFGLAFLMVKLKNNFISFKYKNTPAFFIFIIFIIFLFIGIGQFVESAALGAILAGIALKNSIPKNILTVIDSEIKTMAYGFFAPLFFLSVGLDTNISVLIKFPLLIISIMLLTNTTKIISSYIMTKKYLGSRQSIILGISLCVKFSTSIVILKLLSDKGLISIEVYSILVGAMIAFKFIVPLTMSFLITRWNITKTNNKLNAN